jgi:radical SAM superfamily enzyme YgiQ (UPF0313 family)
LDEAMKITLCTVPVEPDYRALTPKVGENEVLIPSIRSQSQLPIMPKIAIVSIIKWMEKHGWGPDTYDYYDIDMELPSDERLERYFREYQPTVVGLSAVVSTCYSQSRKISQIIRRVCPDAWIVLGGSLAASANVVLRKTDVDLCVVGDGEIPWLAVLEYVKAHGRSWNYEALSRIKGLAYLNPAGELVSTGYGEAIPGKDQPYPDYRILQLGLKDRPQDLSNYFRKGVGSYQFKTDPRSYEPSRRPNLGSLWTTKGCVARCTFCQRSTRGYRVADVGTLDEHLEMLKNTYDVGFLHIIDENFGSDVRYTYELAEVLKKHDMLWMAGGVRVTSFKYDDIKFLKEHGCSSLQFGVESGSQKMLNVMEKNFTVERTFQALSDCASLDINSHLAVMVGMPGETNETVETTGRFLGKVMHLQGIEPEFETPTVFYALPLPGTPLYRYGQQQGLVGKSPDDEEAYLLSVSGTGASKINYINLNGTRLKDVVFWDWLIRLQSARTFFELEREKGIDRSRFFYKAIVNAKLAEKDDRVLTFGKVFSRMRKGLRTGIRARLFYSVDYILNTHVVSKRWAHRRWIPRGLVFGVAKELVYASFLMQRVVARMAGVDFNIHHPVRPVAPLEVDSRPLKVEYKTSLRSIVKLHDVSAGGVKTVSEQNQDVLAIGL